MLLQVQSFNLCRVYFSISACTFWDRRGDLNLFCLRFTGHKNRDYKVDSCLSSSDAQVVSGSEDGRICFWDLVEGKIVHTLEKAHESVVYSISYHPTEIALLSASSDGKVKVWHDSSWEPG